jgi:hypothetical protein
MSLLDALELQQASQYRARAAQLEAEAKTATDADFAAELRELAAAYTRLAEAAAQHEAALL